MTAIEPITTEQAAVRVLTAFHRVKDAANSLPAQGRRLNQLELDSSDEDTCTALSSIDDMLSVISWVLKGHGKTSLLDVDVEADVVKRLREVSASCAFLANEIDRAADELEGVAAGVAESEHQQ